MRVIYLIVLALLALAANVYGVSMQEEHVTPKSDFAARVQTCKEVIHTMLDDRPGRSRLTIRQERFIVLVVIVMVQRHREIHPSATVDKFTVGEVQLDLVRLQDATLYMLSDQFAQFLRRSLVCEKVELDQALAMASPLLSGQAVARAVHLGFPIERLTGRSKTPQLHLYRDSLVLKSVRTLSLMVETNEKPTKIKLPRDYDETAQKVDLTMELLLRGFDLSDRPDMTCDVVVLLAAISREDLFVRKLFPANHRLAKHYRFYKDRAMKKETPLDDSGLQEMF